MEHPNFRVKHYIDHYEATRIKLVRNLAIALIFLLSIVTAMNTTNEAYSFVPNMIGVFMAIIALIYIKYTKNYRHVGIFVSVSGFLIISSAFFTINNVVHYTTPMWMILNILFTFFTLNWRWGLVLLVLHFIVVAVYMTCCMGNNIENIGSFDQLDMVTLVVEYFICGAGIAYTLYMFLVSNNYAEKELKAINSRLLEQNELILKQNKDKDVMLREIHHRVKNNLQVITSLLRLQAAKLDSDNDHFYESINRVKAMALIHEKIYQDETLSNFELHEYLTSLSTNLVDSYTIDRPIDINIKTDPIQMHPRALVPLALLFNELVSNSIKHAFKHSDKAARIDVRITQGLNQLFELNYSDNGKWIESKEDTFGVELIHTMTEQLDGNISFWFSEEGTFYSFALTNISDTFQMQRP